MTREEAIEEIKRWTPILLTSGQCTEETSKAQDMAISALSADVRPNTHGHWKKAKKGITAGELSNLFKCSFCNYELYDDEFNFCPNCGADMREPKGEKGTGCTSTHNVLKR